ncbi:GntR family transcriptional regulator [Fusobacterium simiae]|uniref:GntR family transcriptional regulator n=1 Tax=Fusobacterium simiae TaxID=855 RepID=A0ABT4DHR9_FUSSI|nr:MULTISPECIES: GntR family transcriptional regulator [Fusobacterium]MCY7008155.1 GntR family transcriptional regulator [Fusobacterium simiae]MDC7954251.1 GntR family transcriptional regulator [Fusobacterium simiae]
MKIIKDLLSEQIYKILKNDIINSKINFGEVLVNKNLQERFDVSSTPVRDAILRLKEDGIIEEITRSGAKLIDFNPDFACEVNQLIMTITLGVLEYSLENVENRKEIIDNLNKYIKLQQNNISTDLYYEYDYHFHKTFFDYSNNKLLKDLFKKYNLINEILVKAYHKGDFSLENRLDCLKDHENIIKSIEDNNISMTLDLIKKHYLRADKIFKNSIKIS